MFDNMNMTSGAIGKSTGREHSERGITTILVTLFTGFLIGM